MNCSIQQIDRTPRAKILTSHYLHVWDRWLKRIITCSSQEKPVKHRIDVLEKINILKLEALYKILHFWTQWPRNGDGIAHFWHSMPSTCLVVHLFEYSPGLSYHVTYFTPPNPRFLPHVFAAFGVTCQMSVGRETPAGHILTWLL